MDGQSEDPAGHGDEECADDPAVHGASRVRIVHHGHTGLGWGWLNTGMELPLWQQLLIVAVPALLSIVAAIAAGVFALLARRAEHKAARAQELDRRAAEHKAEVFEPVLLMLGNLLTPSTSEKSQVDMEPVVVRFMSLVILWGSDETIEAFFRFRSSSESQPPTLVTMRFISDFLLAVRRDVAYPNTELGGLHAIGMRINDIGDHPEIEGALSQPLSQLFAESGWEPNFPLKAIGELDGYTPRQA